MIDNDEKDSIRASKEAIREALIDAGATFKGMQIKCPFHDDHSPSGSIYEKNGIWRFKCHGCEFCGDVFDIQARAQNRSVEDVLRDRAKSSAGTSRSSSGSRASAKPNSTPASGENRSKEVFGSIAELTARFSQVERVFTYTNPDTGTAEYIVIRQRFPDGKKNLPTARPVWNAGDGSLRGFELGAPEKPWPIYNRHRLRSADQVIVVEGENKVHALHDAGFVATTSPGGALKARHADWQPMAGKRAILWPDFDKLDPEMKTRKGFEHMHQVKEILRQLDPPADVFWLDPELLGLDEDGSDVVDYLAEYGGSSTESKNNSINCALMLAAPLRASEELHAFIEDSIAGRRRTIPLPWQNLTRLSRALGPGMITVVCGDPGCGKSLLLLEAAYWWHANGIKIALYELENRLGDHLIRVLAQIEQRQELTDSEWLKAHADEARQAEDGNRIAIDSFALRISVSPDEQITHRDLLVWLERQAQGGCRIVIIDPITAVAANDRPWQADLDFLRSAKRIANQFGLSLILVTHPRKGTKGRGVLDDLAGGAAYTRFAETVLWLHRHDKKKKANVSGPIGAFDAEFNRTLRMVKTRNGPGAGLDLAFIFEQRSLRFSEQGVILKPSRIPAGVDQIEIPG